MSGLGDCQGSSPRRGSPRQRQRSEYRSPVRYVPNRRTDQSLGHRIKVRYPCKYKDRSSIASMEAIPVTQEDKSRLQTEYDSLGLVKYETLVTNIYDIRVASDSRRTRAFAFNPCDCEDVSVCLLLNESHPINDDMDYTVHIKVDGKWEKKPASCEYGTITFNAFQIDTFCVSCMPIKEEFVALPSGGCFKSKHNPNVEIRFPKNSLKTSEKIYIQILPADKSRLTEEHTGAPNILALSDCVQVSHSNKFTLTAPARLMLPLNVPIGDWTDQYVLVSLHWTGDDEINIEHIRNIEKEITQTGYNIICDVNEFTGRQLALVKKKAQSTLIKTSAREAVGDKIRCKILVFTAAVHARTRTLRFECVPLNSKRIKETVLACEEYDLIELKQCRSPEFMISVGDRIRVDISGCGRVQRTIPKEHTFIPFFGAMSDNYISLPIDIVEAFGRSVFVVLNFTLLSRSKILVHSTHFDPQTIVRKTRRRRSRSPYNHVGETGNHVFGNNWIQEERKGNYDQDADGSNNPSLAIRRENCPRIAIREPTALSTSELMSTGSISIIRISESKTSSPPTTPSAATPDSSRATSPGTHVMVSSGISRQNSLEVLLGTYPMDDSFTIEKATPKFGYDVFGAKSLHKLAKKVSPNNTMGLAVQLNLDADKVEHILHQYRDNSVLANFKILMGWLGLETGTAEEALETLCNALEEIGYNDLKYELQLAFNDNRPV